MKHIKFLDAVGTILLIIGMVLAFLPHAAHSALGFSEKVSHGTHVAYGVATLVVGLLILIYNNKALRFWKY